VNTRGAGGRGGPVRTVERSGPSSADRGSQLSPYKSLICPRLISFSAARFGHFVVHLKHEYEILSIHQSAVPWVELKSRFVLGREVRNMLFSHVLWSCLSTC